MIYDVFNGDADGIIALVQLRLSNPVKSKLITGVKRDNSLLKLVDLDDATHVNALDISMEKNTQALTNILNKSITVFYCDHHRAGDVPKSDYLKTLVDTSSEVCTSLLISEMLGNTYINWAIAAAYGDNLIATANKLSDKYNLNDQQKSFLNELGTLINYNGYGASLDDLHIDPAALFCLLRDISDPFSLQLNKNSVFYKLQSAYQADYANITAISPYICNDICEVYILPCMPWARRISGVYGNELANKNPTKAHAVLTLNEDGSYLVSVRAPLNNRTGADEVCCKFATGGGRKAAAGINKLAKEDVKLFIDVLSHFYDK
ncbi:hypothetical protein PMAN_a1879 [Pseudoalteromonas marina]|uniref:hypothetical protein n=1 Tax=Pseudoalteromonas marina TaxID=267375 RepID=UPI00026CEA32|nr:hypothetical protein [Pseudoalteromonas marina]KAF7780786.1 hypothetical protein PMAN_a1879 [Pseudoalteromonas marina]